MSFQEDTSFQESGWGGRGTAARQTIWISPDKCCISKWPKYYQNTKEGGFTSLWRFGESIRKELTFSGMNRFSTGEVLVMVSRKAFILKSMQGRAGELQVWTVKSGSDHSHSFISFLAKQHYSQLNQFNWELIFQLRFFFSPEYTVAR